MSAHRRLRASLLQLLRGNGRFSAGSFLTPSVARRGSRLGSRRPVHAGRRAGPGPTAQASPGPPLLPRRRERVNPRAAAQLRSPAAGSRRAGQRDNIHTSRDRSGGSGCDGSYVPPIFRVARNSRSTLSMATRSPTRRAWESPALIPVEEISPDLTGTPDGRLPCRQPAERWRMRRSCGRGSAARTPKGHYTSPEKRFARK